MADTAIDGVNRVLAENKEKVSLDYKILKHINCKGVAPQLMTVKTKRANPLLENMDMSKAETKLQKDIMGQRKEFKDQQEKEAYEKQQMEERMKEA